MRMRLHTSYHYLFTAVARRSAQLSSSLDTVINPHLVYSRWHVARPLHACILPRLHCKSWWL
jgi:hypothetical protein